MDTNLQYRNDLLAAWEETYKKGQLTLWIFLALKDGPKYVNTISEFIHEYSGNAISCEEQSLYRALRKFSHMELVTFETGKGNKGPDRKYYQLTDLGSSIVDEFIDRQIRVFFTPKLTELLGMKRG